jgi:hypothetical protein
MKAEGCGEKYPVKKGTILRQANDVTAVVSKVRQLKGVLLEGDYDCMYRYTNLVRVKTKKGWRPKGPFEYIGWIDGEMLEKALACTGEWFGSGYYHHD